MTTTQKQQEFYDKEFKGEFFGTTISRGELESLPCPFCTDYVTDETMQQIINDIEADVKWTLRLCNSDFDFENDKHSECWWNALEIICREYNIPYYEDLEEAE